MTERSPSELYQFFRRGFRDEATGKYPRDAVHGNEPAYRIGRECASPGKNKRAVPLEEKSACAMFAELVGHESTILRGEP